MVTPRGTQAKFKIKVCIILGIVFTVIPVSTSRGAYHRYRLSTPSFNDHFENYYNTNTYLTSEQREQFEAYWACVLTGKTSHIHQSLQWMAQHGHFDDYFMALNYLVYVHDNHLKSPQLLQIIEKLIDESVQQNIIQSSIMMTNSVTYNIVKYLLSRFRPKEPIHDVPYSKNDFKAPSQADIEGLIKALRPQHGHLQFYALMTKFIRGLPSSVYQQLDFKQPARVCLQNIFTILIDGHRYISPELYQAANYYLAYFKQQDFKNQSKQRNIQIFRELINYVPNFPSPHRDVLIQCLMSEDVIQDLVKLAGHPVASESYLYNLLLKGLSHYNIPGQIHDAFQFYINYFQSLNVFSQLSHKLPKFINTPGKKYYHLLAGYLNGPEFQSVLGTVGTGSLDLKSTDLLCDTLALLKSDTHVSSEIQTAASYYLQYYDILAVKEKYSLNKLFTLIPQASLASERVYYDNIQRLFASTTFLKVILESNLQMASDQMMMLHEIMNCALQSSVIKVEYKEAILHYLKLMYNEGLTIEQQQKIEFLLEELHSIHIETPSYETISTFLRSDMIYLIFVQYPIDFTESSLVILEHIFEVITPIEYLDNSIREAANDCNIQVHNQYSLEDELIKKIHHAFINLQAVSETKASKYEADMNVFLQCDEMHTIIRHSHLDRNMDANELLYAIFCILEEDVNVSMEIRQGAYHYSKYILEPLLGNVPCNTNELLTLLPQPTNNFTHKYFNILKNYLQLGVPRFLSLQIDFTKTSVDLLMDILQALEYCDRIPVDVRGTARYYWHFFNKNTIHIDINFLKNKLDRLSLLLPKPTSIHESQYYNLMVNYLKGQHILNLLNTININVHKPDERILRDILVMALNTKHLYMDIKIVARYYLNMIDNGVIGNVSHVIVENEEYLQNQHISNIQNVQTNQETVMRQHAVNVASINKMHEDISTDTSIIQEYVENHADNIKDHQIQSARRNLEDYATKSTSTTLGTAAAKSALQKPLKSTQNTHATQTVQTAGTTASNIAKVATTASTQEAATSTAAAKSVSTVSEMKSEAISTISASMLSIEQVAILQNIESALNQIVISDTYIPDQQILQNYLKTELAYNLLVSSGVDVTASGSILLAAFVQIATHTNDIPLELRLACERFEQVIPELKASVLVTPYIHLVALDNIFHKIEKSIVEAASVNVLICYNAIDRYLHSEVPSKFLENPRIDLKIAPMEVLQDFILISQECTMPSENISFIQELMKRHRETVDVVERPLLDHLYRLHKVFQLFEIPRDTNCVEFYYTIDSFMKSDTIFKYLKYLDFNVDLKDLQKSILTMIINSSSVTMSSDIIEAAVYYNNLIFTPTIENEVLDVFHLLPKPEEEQGVQAYETVNEYIHSPAALEVTKNVNFDIHRRPQSILTNVLDLTSHTGRVNPKVKHAAGYLLTKARTPSRMVIPQSRKKVFSQTSVHSMKSLAKFRAERPKSKYMSLLSILPSSYTTGEDFTVLTEYFTDLTQSMVESLISQEEMTHLNNNEEGLFRLILLRVTNDMNQPDNIRNVFSHLIKQRYFDFSVFLTLIPSATIPEEENHRNLLIDFFNGGQIYRHIDLSVTEYETTMECFTQILTKLSICEELPTDIKQACLYYLSHSPFFETRDLIMQLPQPNSNNIKKLYSTMVEFLSNKELIYKCTKNIDLNKFVGSHNLLLNQILLEAEKCDWLEENIRVAAKYYLTLIKSVSISVRKVLTKTLDLGEIFSDAFDFSSFTKLQFDAYHIFWTYVSERTQELLALPAFDFWTNNNKRGEFTAKFLAAICTTELPQNILDYIEILKPLVHLDNGGALAV